MNLTWDFCYNVSSIVPTTEDVEALPHFRRDQLVLTKFLGSGAFGEVFEGVAMNVISEDSGETTVAVKVWHFLLAATCILWVILIFVHPQNNYSCLATE